MSASGTTVLNATMPALRSARNSTSKRRGTAMRSTASAMRRRSAHSPASADGSCALTATGAATASMRWASHRSTSATDAIDALSPNARFTSR